jgi:hypothetical protein
MAVGAQAAAPSSGNHTQASAKAPVSPPVAPPTAKIQKTQRQHSKCKSPKGQRLSISYSPGWYSTTIYFNNHCGQKRSFQPMMASRTGKRGPAQCITVNAHTKGHKKVRTPGYVVTDVKFLAKCK